MSKRIKALRIAEGLEFFHGINLLPAAAELRRLHEVNVELVNELQRIVRFLEVEDARLANFGEVEAARSVIAKATGKQP